MTRLCLALGFALLVLCNAALADTGHGVLPHEEAVPRVDYQGSTASAPHREFDELDGMSVWAPRTPASVGGQVDSVVTHPEGLPRLGPQSPSGSLSSCSAEATKRKLLAPKEGGVAVDRGTYVSRLKNLFRDSDNDDCLPVESEVFSLAHACALMCLKDEAFSYFVQDVEKNQSMNLALMAGKKAHFFLRMGSPDLGARYEIFANDEDVSQVDQEIATFLRSTNQGQPVLRVMGNEVTTFRDSRGRSASESPQSYAERRMEGCQKRDNPLALFLLTVSDSEIYDEKLSSESTATPDRWKPRQERGPSSTSAEQRELIEDMLENGSIKDSDFRSECLPAIDGSAAEGELPLHYSSRFEGKKSPETEASPSEDGPTEREGVRVQAASRDDSSQKSAKPETSEEESPDALRARQPNGVERLPNTDAAGNGTQTDTVRTVTPPPRESVPNPNHEEIERKKKKGNLLSMFMAFFFGMLIGFAF